MYSNLRERNGKYTIVIGYKDENGAWHEKTKKTGLAVKGNKRKAEAMMEEYLAAFEQNRTLMPIEQPNQEIKSIKEIDATENKILFGEYLLQWLDRIKPTIEISSYAGYKMNIQGSIAPYFNEKKIYLQDLTPQLIDEFYEQQLIRVSANTVIHFHANIRKALQDAFIDGIIPYNFADRAHRPKKEVFIGSYYNREELIHLFQCIKGQPIEFAVLMAGYYGLRRSEIIGLKWSAVDFDYKTITIKHVVSECRIDGKLLLVSKDRAKTKTSIRTLPLMTPIENILMRMRASEKLNKEKFGSGYNHKYDEYIYKNEIGDLIKPGFLTQNFPIQLNRYNLRKIRFHDLRHSCATLLRHEGVPMEDIQKWLGHSEITTTEKIYAHFENKQHEKSAEKLCHALSTK